MHMKSIYTYRSDTPAATIPVSRAEGDRALPMPDEVVEATFARLGARLGAVVAASSGGLVMMPVPFASEPVVAGVVTLDASDEAPTVRVTYPMFHAFRRTSLVGAGYVCVLSQPLMAGKLLMSWHVAAVGVGEPVNVQPDVVLEFVRPASARDNALLTLLGRIQTDTLRVVSHCHLGSRIGNALLGPATTV